MNNTFPAWAVAVAARMPVPASAQTANMGPTPMAMASPPANLASAKPMHQDHQKHHEKQGGKQ
jgi:hypothetical protein